MKIKHLLLYGLSLFVLQAQAQDLIPVKNKKDKWGYEDSNGNLVIKHNYNEALAFVDGRAKVRKGDKWGYINTSGQEVIPFKYTEIGTWNDNRAKVAVGGKEKDGVLTDAKYGFISYTGEILVKPEYDKIGPFENGVAYVVKGGKYGYIDQHYTFIVKPEYSAVGKFNDKGYCWVAKNGKIANGKITNGALGVVNRQGEIVIKPEYAQIGTFTRTINEANPVYARLANNPQSREKMKKAMKEASKGMGTKAFMAGLTGDTEELAEETTRRTKIAADRFMAEMQSDLELNDSIMLTESPRWDLLGYEFIDGKLFSELDMSQSDCFAVSKTRSMSNGIETPWLISLKTNDKIGIFDKYGKAILKCGQYPVAFLPSDGLIPVAKSNKNGLEVNYVKSDGKLLLKKWAKAEAVAPFFNGTAIIAQNNAHYLIDRNGNKISSEYRYILPQSNGTHIVAGSNGYGMINDRGEEVAPATWHLIVPSDNGIYCARKDAGGKYGYIGGDGKYVIEPTYAEGRPFRGNTAPVRSESGWGLIDKDNRSVVECKWSDILPTGEATQNLCWVKNGDAWQCLDVSTKKFAFEDSFASVHNFDETKHAIVVNGAGLYGYIDSTGRTVIPARLSNPGVIRLCLDYLKAQNLTGLSDIQAHRFNLENNPARNGFRLSHTIDNTMWSY